MVRYENECCSCSTPSYPCRGNDCSNRHVPHFFCDRCECEFSPRELHYTDDGEELCEDCLKEAVPTIQHMMDKGEYEV